MNIPEKHDETRDVVADGPQKAEEVQLEQRQYVTRHIMSCAVK